jgi:hypothetical protein
MHLEKIKEVLAKETLAMSHQVNDWDLQHQREMYNFFTDTIDSVSNLREHSSLFQIIKVVEDFELTTLREKELVIQITNMFYS